MAHEFNFGRRPAAVPQQPGPVSRALRIAVLGDFSGRANRGQLETGAELARRKPIKLDVDNIEDVLRSFATSLHLPVGSGGANVELRPRSIDDLHPDALYESVPLFSDLADLRQRIENPRTCKAAADELATWPIAAPTPRNCARSRQARGSAMRVNARLHDFARLIGRPTVQHDAPVEAEELVRLIVAPYLVAAEARGHDELTAAVGQALSDAMRSILHHPDFQALEAAWRTLDFLVRRISTSARLQIVVYDITAEELAADLSASEALERTGLYQLLVEQPLLDAHQGPLSALIGNYMFEMTPPHAELLGRIARIAAAVQAPFIAAVGPDCITTRIEDVHPLVAEAWQALRALPEAGFVALTVPRFLLRTPYGAKTEPIESFEFEEFDARTGLKAMLWGNSAALGAVLLANNFLRHGAAMSLRSILSLDDLAYFVYDDADGEQTALPCTERLLTQAKAAHVTAQHFLAVLATKGRAAIRLAGFQSLGGGELFGPWTPPEQLKAAASAGAPNAAPSVPTPDIAPAESLPAASARPDKAEPSAVAAEPDDGAGTAASDEPPRDTDSAELDALLAELASASEHQAGADAPMDPELAALLADM